METFFLGGGRLNLKNLGRGNGTPTPKITEISNWGKNFCKCFPIFVVVDFTPIYYTFLSLKI